MGRPSGRCGWRIHSDGDCDSADTPRLLGWEDRSAGFESSPSSAATPLTAAAAAAALTAQAELAAAPGVSHRVKPVDLLIASVASTEGLGVLHYDRAYDALAEHTSLSIASVWIAPRGSLG